MALGASRAQAARIVLVDTMRLLVIGIGIGLPLAIAASRFIRSELYGLNADDPVSLALAVSVLTITAVGAAYLPARRAARIEPMVALRTE